MAVLSVYIINKAGGLIYQYDHNCSRPEVEKTFGFPLEVVLKVHDDKVVVAFGERDTIKGVFSTLFYVSHINDLRFPFLKKLSKLCRLYCIAFIIFKKCILYTPVNNLEPSCQYILFKFIM